MPRDAAIGQEITPYCPGRCHGHRFWHKKSSCGFVKSLFEASDHKARSCVDMSNTTIKAKEPRNFSSYQTLLTDKNWWSYQAVMKLINKLALMSATSCKAVKRIHLAPEKNLKALLHLIVWILQTHVITLPFSHSRYILWLKCNIHTNTSRASD